MVLPVSVAGHPALDFCNTRAGWGSPRPKEYLLSYEHLAVWARANGLVDPDVVAGLRDVAARTSQAAARTLARTLAFRSALYAVLVGTATARDWATVNREVRRAASASTLTATLPAQWRVADQSRLDLPLHVVAWSAAQLLTTPVVRQVAACPGDGCGWLFADRRGRRRWCSMAWCGNRNKVRRHAERARAAAATERAPN